MVAARASSCRRRAARRRRWRRGAGAGRRVAAAVGGGGNWLDATHVLATRTSNGGKTRTTEAIDITGGPPKMLHEETVDKFFSQVNATGAAISPDRKWLLFTADTTGWDQIYVVPTAGGAPVQITKTPGEHWRAAWSHDSRRIAWDTNTAEKPGDRHIEIATIGDDPAKATIVDGHVRQRHQHVRRSGRPTTSACSISTRTARTPRISTSPTPPPTPSPRADVVDAGEHRQVDARRAAAHALPGAGRQVGAGVAVRAEESRSHEAARGHRLDSSRRREHELRRLASRSQRGRLLRVPSVPAAAGLRRHRARLPRQHRLRARLAQRRLHGRRRQRREGRAHGRDVSQDARLRGRRTASACGA